MVINKLPFWKLLQVEWNNFFFFRFCLRSFRATTFFSAPTSASPITASASAISASRSAPFRTSGFFFPRFFFLVFVQSFSGGNGCDEPHVVDLGRHHTAKQVSVDPKLVDYIHNFLSTLIINLNLSYKFRDICLNSKK